MSLAVHCDYEGCNTWATLGTEFVEEFVIVQIGTSINHFCTPWHSLQWLATWAEPSVEIEN